MEQGAVAPLPGYAARAPSAEDAGGVTSLLREAEFRDFGEAEADAGELAADWATFDLPRDAVVVCDDAGTIAGYGYFFRRGLEQAIIDVYVHPEHTGRGVGTYLVAELERRAGDVARIGSGIPATNEAGRTLLEERGYSVVRRFWRMTIDHDRHPPAPVWPDGTLPTRYLARDECAIWAAIEEAFEDHWEYRPEPFDDWRRRAVERQGFDPTLWIVAKDGLEVAGVVLGRDEPTAGRIEETGMRVTREIDAYERGMK